MIRVAGVQEILLMALAAALWLLPVIVVVYVLLQLRSLNHGLRRLQTEIEELRRDLGRGEK